MNRCLSNACHTCCHVMDIDFGIVGESEIVILGSKPDVLKQPFGQYDGPDLEIKILGAKYIEKAMKQRMQLNFSKKPDCRLTRGC